MYRTSSYRRHKRYVKIARKKNLVHEMNDYWYYKFDGQYDKGKIHCSCPLCSAKYSINGPDIRDIKKLESLKFQIQEFQIAS